MVPAVVLAAGKSSRMGRPKALLPVDQADTFLTRILRTLQEADVEDLVVVVGHEAEAVVASVLERGLSPRFVVNEQYESGQLSSVLAGMTFIDRPGVTAMLMTLVDVPLVSAPTVRAVIDRYRRTHAVVVRPVSGARHGHPVIIDRRLFDAIRAADASTGAKPVVRANASPQGDVQVDDEGAFLDIDTPEDYLRLLGRSEAPTDAETAS
jgi:molybdenum cofactor cytidylyltransferase